MMKKFRTVGSVIIMALAAFAGMFVADWGPIVFTLIAGFACVVYAIDNRNQ